MIRRPPRSTRTDTLFPYTTLFRSLGALPVRIFVADGIHDDLAQPRCHGANLRLSPVGTVLARLEKPFAHLLAREIEVGFIGKDRRHLAESVALHRKRRLVPRTARGSDFDRVGYALLVLDRPK